jgi:hypothetical protein
MERKMNAILAYLPWLSLAFGIMIITAVYEYFTEK